MPDWRLFQNLRFWRARRYLSTGSQVLFGKTAPSDYRPEAGCVVIRFGTIVIRPLRVRLIVTGIGVFPCQIQNVLLKSTCFDEKWNGL